MAVAKEQEEDGVVDHSRSDVISVRAARTHNLRSVDLTIPRGKFVVVTGVSGCGKSSLAFDTIHAEGRRQFLETLSTYARQFVEQLPRPAVDWIEGLPPTIAVDQQPVAPATRAVPVGTTTEILDYLRLLYARVGVPHCPKCGVGVRPQTIEQIETLVAALPSGTKAMLLAPLISRAERQTRRRPRRGPQSRLRPSSHRRRGPRRRRAARVERASKPRCRSGGRSRGGPTRQRLPHGRVAAAGSRARRRRGAGHTPSGKRMD